MSKKRRRRKMSDTEIVAVYNMIEADDPDISTERLLAMTADSCHCDVDDVVYALMRESEDQ